MHHSSADNAFAASADNAFAVSAVSARTAANGTYSTIADDVLPRHSADYSGIPGWYGKYCADEYAGDVF